MTTNLRSPKKLGILLMAMLFNFVAYSATFTAVLSGNWSSSTTWGGAAPSFNPTTDIIIIPSGINVNMDNNVTINNASAVLNVSGALSNSANTLTLTSGTISGAGTINVSGVTLGAGAIFSFTGYLTTNTLSNAATSLQAGANVMVNQTLTLTSGIFTIKSGGTLGAANNTTIVLAGGQLAVSGGTLALGSNYNVNYTTSGVTGGAELTGSGLKNVTVNTGSGNNVTLASDLTVNGTLSMTSGTLDLGGKNLTITGDLASSGTGTIKSTSTSNIVLNSTSGIAGTLDFAGTSNAVNNLTVIN